MEYSKELTYDDSSKDSIFNHASKLIDKTLHDLYPEAVEYSTKGKGKLGENVEYHHFCIKNNNEPVPDLYKVGVDIKCTPLVLKNEIYVSKERLTLCKINYENEFAIEKIEESSFWHKCQLLILFYLHKAVKSCLDLTFLIVRYWHIPEEDLHIIKEDWIIIHEMIKNKKAHELSESRTLYLVASTKAEKSSDRSEQGGYKSPLAKPRAFSFRQSYVDYIISDTFSLIKNKDVSVSSSANVLQSLHTWKPKLRKNLPPRVYTLEDIQKGYTLESLIISKFEPFYGKTIAEIAKIQGCSTFSLNSKDAAYKTCLLILGVKGKKIEEFEKADICVKTIVLENGQESLKEHMSFPYFDYVELLKEKSWTESKLYEQLIRRFCFVVFEKGNNKNIKRLKGVFFWGMNNTDLSSVRKVWKDTQLKIRANQYSRFIKASENKIAHIRPHGENSKDVVLTPQNTYEVKKSFWLNNLYIYRQVFENLRLFDYSSNSILVYKVKSKAELENIIKKGLCMSLDGTGRLSMKDIMINPKILVLYKEKLINKKKTPIIVGSYKIKNDNIVYSTEDIDEMKFPHYKNNYSFIVFKLCKNIKKYEKINLKKIIENRKVRVFFTLNANEV